MRDLLTYNLILGNIPPSTLLSLFDITASCTRHTYTLRQITLDTAKSPLNAANLPPARVPRPLFIEPPFNIVLWDSLGVRYCMTIDKAPCNIVLPDPLGVQFCRVKRKCACRFVLPGGPRVRYCRYLTFCACNMALWDPLRRPKRL